MNQSKPKSKQVLDGKTRTFSEKGEALPGSDEAAEASLLVTTNRRGAYISDVNPFLFETVRDMQVRNKRLTLKRGTPVPVESPDGTQGEVFTTIEQNKSLDRKAFVKVFSGPMFREVFNLTPPGLKMYLVVLDILGDVSSINKVYIRLTTKQAMNLTEKYGCAQSKTTVNRGIGELIEKNYLAGAEINGETEGWYWINPQYFFNGDTVIFKQTLKLDRQVNGAKARDEEPVIKRPDVPSETVYAAMQTHMAMNAGKHRIVYGDDDVNDDAMDAASR